MTIRHFQIFKAVCESGGVTAAAARLNITQPTVSIAIRELEVFYDTRLFDRINRKIYLTEAGEILRQYAESVLAQFEEAAATLRSGTVFSKCRLGVNLSFAETHLPALAAAIRARLPECELQIAVRNNERLEEMLADNSIDLAVHDGAAARISKYIQPLFTEKMALLVAPSIYNRPTIRMAELAEQPLLLREAGSGVRSCVDQVFLSRGLGQRIAAESASTLSLLALAGQGAGVMFAPLTLAQKEARERGLAVVALADAEMARCYRLVYNGRKHLTGVMEGVRDQILELRSRG